MSDIASSISNMTQSEIKHLADMLEPHFRQRELHRTKIFGNPSRLHIGQNVSLVDTLFNTISGDIYIEDFVFFGHGVKLLTGTHAADQVGHSRMVDVPREGRDIVIKSGAWIASGAIILGPCTIGADAVIGAGSVVIGGVVPDGWFYAGNPAKPIKPVVPGTAVTIAKPQKLGWLKSLMSGPFSKELTRRTS